MVQNAHIKVVLHEVHIKFKFFKFKFFIDIYIHQMKNNTECNIKINSSLQLLQRSNE